MRGLPFGALVAALTLASSAQASTFVINYENRPSVDPAENFEADCLGASEKPDCASRAAALEAELVELLGVLEGLSDSETVALFATAVAIDSPGVQEVGLRYFSRRRNLPVGLWANVKAFFFGPDPSVGQPSAEILGDSEDAIEQQLSELYLELRPSSKYGGYIPEDLAGEDSWAATAFRDQQLDAVEAFPEEQRFAPASRLLMIDRFLTNYQNPAQEVPVSGFVTDAPKADVEAHFTALFKKPPYPPTAVTEAKLQALNAELAALTPKVQSGDKQAIARLQTVIMETTQLQEAVSVGGVLGLDDEQTASHVFWLDGPADAVYAGTLARAVVVGTDPLLNKTAIRYVGSSKPAAQADGGGVGGGGPNDPAPNDPDGGVGPVDEAPGKKSDGGCSLAASPGAGAAYALLLALLLWRRRSLQRPT